jgi:putative tricarboxylic transport membrane protein
MAEESVRQSLVLSRGDFMVFLTHPISCVSIIIAVILVFSPVIKVLVQRRVLYSQEG